MKVAVVGNGPKNLIPDLSPYESIIDLWIGADRGALTIIDQRLPLDLAVGDFDSISSYQKRRLEDQARKVNVYPVEKDQTDIEIALSHAYSYQPNELYLFGVTGGRLDHELINIQLLHHINQKGINGIMIDHYNQIQLTTPGTHHVKKDKLYPYISFIPLTQTVEGLSLEGFYYPLEYEDISWGSTLCISNQLISNYGTFSYGSGILLLVKSRDAMSNTIPM
ncbi:thiamine diphosphokinase [Oceanobacillus halotolerans]|uniref:thiamine diphosphokinase n=1 Tax=Oceanobacillus halotolerans TaxID=2663380 RepID=UPI0013DD187D|nr:thiamine diphosphokinase [Oceanobacillus halotolerans]